MTDLPPGFKMEMLTLIRAELDGRPVIPATARVIEGGAGYGVVTDVLTRLACRVIALEPLPDIFDELRQRTAFTANLVTLCAALAAGNAPTVTMRRAALPGNSSIWPIDYDVQVSALEVLVADVDTLITEHGADTLVLDIEGAECDLLSAADLRPINTMVVEWHPGIVGTAAVAHASVGVEAAGLRHRINTPSWGNQAHVAVYRRDPVYQ